ncbi:hypothetical protein IMG5_078650 [Ichthyophthirius multifiliis]|uniref:Uncharacterized protein n=1 Tax=Ichthyophthirius multifiliis TaxID=5932 RepID=G0QQG4_ICHMU|nr:hypothetical protein IMG5_078650 [Ichthyophthirius multifiliis]EGR32539.1 hypothetical protein IMG5_078650 [Ichthyophthirius multifiliis]|eukprot:XP_004036525.1 hypothetical protein IMG5_078650 [Ichthyophthirius multifiliis]
MHRNYQDAYQIVYVKEKKIEQNKQKYTQHNTNIEQIFGSYLSNYIKYLNCQNINRTFEFILDLSIQLNNENIQQQKNYIPLNTIDFLQEQNEEQKQKNQHQINFQQSREVSYQKIEEQNLQNINIPNFDIKKDQLYQPNLKIKNKVTYQIKKIQCLLDDFFAVEKFDKQNNQYKCEKCGQKFFFHIQKNIAQIERQYYLYEPPKILTIVLKRFQQKNDKTLIKNVNQVDICEQISINEYSLIKLNQQQDNNLIKQYNYKLYANICHSGSINQGHYTAYVKHYKDGKYQWYYYNDEKYEESDIQSELIDIFNQYDKNGDRTLDYKEFIQILFEERNSKTQKNNQFKSENQSYSFSKFQQKLLSRGATGILGIARQFRIFDDDNSKTLCFSEFRKAVRDFQVDITDQQIQEVFEYFDKDGNGTINYDEFLLSIRGPMNQIRRRLVHQAFNILDKDCSGIVDLYDIKQIYNGKMHPDVKSGKRTEESVLLEFINTFESYTGFRGIKDGQITLEEFEDYYSFISASIDRDDYFTLMMNNAWRMNDGQNKNWDTKGWSNQQQQGGGNSNQKKQFISSTTQNAPFGTSNIPTDYGTNLRPNTAQQYQQNNNDNCNNLRQGGGIQKGGQQGQQYFNTFRAKLLARGTRGIQCLGRLFRNIDDDNSKSLSLREFQKCCKDLRMGFNEQESATLFRLFDRDGSGEIDYNEFLISVVGEMNKFRKGLVMQAFNKLDKNKNGTIEVDDIIGVYNAKQHPDVRNGKKSEEEILGEFLDTFEQHHASLRDRQVSTDEFIEYYNNVSASIDDDKYFEVMIRNAWKI